MTLQVLIIHYAWLAFNFSKECFCIDEYLHFYRRYDGNVSSYLGTSKNPLRYKLAYRIKYIVKFFLYKFKNGDK